jgi:hypothetical protein
MSVIQLIFFFLSLPVFSILAVYEFWIKSVSSQGSCTFSVYRMRSAVSEGPIRAETYVPSMETSSFLNFFEKKKSQNYGQCPK